MQIAEGRPGSTLVAHFWSEVKKDVQKIKIADYNPGLFGGSSAEERPELSAML